MTQAEWLTGSNPSLMLEHLWGRTTDRKMRLLACACCRRIWHLLEDERSRCAVAIAEKHFDSHRADLGRHSAAILAEAAARQLHQQASQLGPRAAVRARSLALAATAAAAVWQRSSLWNQATAAGRAAGQAAAAAAGATKLAARLAGAAGRPASKRERAAQCALLRDVFGNPFAVAVMDLSWLTSTVVAVAQAIYAERAFERMPILADALEDAGCTDQEILAHCRGPGPHVLGCWLLDLLLDKE
jgi:hypothetical protein